jgi:hypothetical protein
VESVFSLAGLEQQLDPAGSSPVFNAIMPTESRGLDATS